MTKRQQRWYSFSRSVWLAPVGGFVYLFLNPRITWLRGSVGLVGHILRSKWDRPGESIRSLALEFKTPYWSSRSEYWHMFWNNIFLFGLLAVMAWLVGPMLFLVCYVVSLSLAGGAGIVLFTVQHNFEHSYASAEDGWDCNRAALHGTSWLVLPQWLNWFTANIGFHHVHHLSARVPFYHLAACHAEHQDHFRDVKRLTLSQIPDALKCVLWDTRARRIVSVLEHTRQSAPLTAA
jgi:omega-6 fatty acid desaturase (delta-12 desaturase)